MSRNVANVDYHVNKADLRLRDGSWSQQDALSFAYVVHLHHTGTELLSADELQMRIEIARQGPRQRYLLAVDDGFDVLA
jgi:hypothetical protein